MSCACVLVCVAVYCRGEELTSCVLVRVAVYCGGEER